MNQQISKLLAPPDPTLERLRTAQVAIAALIVHDGLPLKKVFSMLETEVLQRLGGEEGVVERARALLAGTALTAPALPREEPAKSVADPPPHEPATAPQPLDGDFKLTSTQAAEYLGCTKGNLSFQRWSAKKNGTECIPFTKQGHSILYRKADLDAWKARPSKPAAKPAAKPAPASDELVTSTQAAQMLDLDRKTLENDRSNSQRSGGDPLVPFVRVGSQAMYRRAVLEKLLEKPSPRLRVYQERHQQALRRRVNNGSASTERTAHAAPAT